MLPGHNILRYHAPHAENSDSEKVGWTVADCDSLGGGMGGYVVALSCVLVTNCNTIIIIVLSIIIIVTHLLLVLDLQNSMKLLCTYVR